MQVDIKTGHITKYCQKSLNTQNAKLARGVFLPEPAAGGGGCGVFDQCQLSFHGINRTAFLRIFHAGIDLYL